MNMVVKRIYLVDLSVDENGEARYFQSITHAFIKVNSEMERNRLEGGAETKRINKFLRAYLTHLKGGPVEKQM